MYHQLGVTWCCRRFLRLHSHYAVQRKWISSKRTGVPTSQEVRTQFIEYFKSKDHLNVPSSSIVPSKGDGTYFVNAGMNQFKPIFLGTVDPNSDMAFLKRAVNSQKCIRVGGKHNDLEDVGKDTTHHTFFEMLGSWSFGDYFKREACEMAWELLTKDFRIPEDKLYVTYFSGDENLGLAADEECRDIWLSMGVPKSHVFPMGMKDNFWDMGDTGPCGPCTEIHYNKFNIDPARVYDHMSAGHPGVVELWNLVFMQFNRREGGSLEPLPRNHVDTGMGFERITSVLQNVLSNYDTDLFLPLFQTIRRECKCPPYTGLVGDEDVKGLDTAYRIIADHARMATISITDGLLPGRKNLDARLRQIIYRAFRHSHHAMAAPKGLLAKLVPVVVDSLGGAFPELLSNPAKVQDVINEAEERYLEQVSFTNKVLHAALREMNHPKQLSFEDIQRIVDGHYGGVVNVEILAGLAADSGLPFDLDAYNQQLHELNLSSQPESAPQEVSNTLDQYQVKHLMDEGITATDDSFKYDQCVEQGSYYFESQFAKTLAIVNGSGEFVQKAEEGDTVGLVLDRTSFYSEGGGQAADKGMVTSVKGMKAEVIDVQKTQQYVLHTCRITQGELCIGDSVTLAIDQVHRAKCMCNHTATHLLNFALKEVLGSDVRQAGSSVNADRLHFEFRCFQTKISPDEIREISAIVNKCIAQGETVHRAIVPLNEIEAHPYLIKLDQEVYPRDVCVVSVGTPVNQCLSRVNEPDSGRHSLELCGGTHVANTSDIGSFVISNFHGTGQGTKKVTAVTGELAQQAIENGLRLAEDIDKFESFLKDASKEDWILPLSDLIEKAFSDGHTLPKADRDILYQRFEHLKFQGVRHVKNKSKSQQLLQDVTSALSSHESSPFVLASLEKTKSRDIMKLLTNLHTDELITKPLILLYISSDSGQFQGLLAMPECQESGNFSSKVWAEYLCSHLEYSKTKDAKTDKFKGKLKGLSVWAVNAKKGSRSVLDIARELSSDFCDAKFGNS